jgi:hypothetical protein
MLIEGLAVLMGAVVQGKHIPTQAGSLHCPYALSPTLLFLLGSGFIVDGITNPDENHSRCNCSTPDSGANEPFVVNQSVRQAWPRISVPFFGVLARAYPPYSPVFFFSDL